jgi:hypothetical protein
VRIVKAPENSEVLEKSHTVSSSVTSSKGIIFYKDRANVKKTLYGRSESSTGPDPQECVEQIDRLVAIPSLHGSEALCKLLQYLAHHTLNSPANHLKEYQIGTEVLGRPADFDPQTDSIVRMQMGRLRTKLNEYYNSDGARDPILVDVPKGRYALSFERKAHPSEQDGTGEEATHAPAPAFAHRWRNLASLIVVVLAIGCCTVLWFQKRAAQNSLDVTQSSLDALQRSFYPWQYEPSVSAFWSDVLKANPNTDIVLADTSYGLLQATTGIRFGLNDYINRSYISQIQAAEMRPEMHDALSRIASWRLASIDEFKLARGILALDPMGQKMHIYSARDFMPDLIKRDNVVLIGGSLTNPWEALFEDRLNFTMIFDKNGSPTIVNKAPGAGERNSYVGSAIEIRSRTDIGSGTDNEYCLVAYLPNPDHSGVVILLEGTDAVSSEAAGDFLLSEDQLSDFKNILHVTRFPFFEVLLKISEVRGTPLTTTIESYRTYPNLH